MSRGEADELSSFAVSGTSGGAVVCAVTGEIDISNADEFAAQLARAATRGREVVVDLSGVTFLASAGIRVLIDAAIGGAMLLAPRGPALRAAVAARVVADASDAVVFGTGLPERDRRLRIAGFALGWAALCALSGRWTG